MPVETKLHLTRREYEIISSFAEGKTRIQIAEKFDISIRTVDFHINEMSKKLGFSSEPCRSRGKAVVERILAAVYFMVLKPTVSVATNYARNEKTFKFERNDSLPENS